MVRRYRKYSKIRGGYRVPAAAKPIVKQALANLPDRVKKAHSAVEHMFPGITSHTMNMGTQLLHNLVQNKGGKFLKMPSIGSTVTSVGQGEVSYTKYKSKIKRTRTIASKIASSSSRYEMICQNAFRMTSVVGGQNAYDMTYITASTGYSSTDGPPAASIYGATWTSFTAPSTFNNISLALPRMSLMAGNAGGSTARTSKIYHRNCIVESSISNLSQYPIEVDIYEVIAKHDTNQLNFAGTSLGNTGPVFYWSQGLIDTTFTSGGYPKEAYTTLGSRPFDSEMFNSYWRICSKHTVALSVGDVHKHISEYHIDGFIDPARYFYSTNLAGITRNIMFVIRGTPVRDTLDANKIGIGPATANVVQEIVYKYNTVPYNALYTGVVNTLSTPVISETVTPTIGDVDTTLNPA